MLIVRLVDKKLSHIIKCSLFSFYCSQNAAIYALTKQCLFFYQIVIVYNKLQKSYSFTLFNIVFHKRFYKPSIL